MKNGISTVLTIAGSDSIGGAGIQADLKTITCLGGYGMSVITALTAQNTLGVAMVENASLGMIAAQIDAVFLDIVPDAVKLGMIATPEIMELICDKLSFYKAKNIVVDPVMVATSGSSLMENRTVATLKEKLIPLADIITPNLSETGILTGNNIANRDEMLEAAKQIAENYQGGILIKGGHLSEEAADLLYYKGEVHWYTGTRYDNENTHGTGCTLSSAIATFLAKGEDVPSAVEHGKAYVAGAIKEGMNIGKGRGPLQHNYVIRK